MIRTFDWLLMSLAILGFACTTSAAPKPAEITDPKEAQEDPDFSIQGEYLGEGTLLDGTKDKVGAQVIASGKGKFRVVVYRGGLPGAGWSRGGERFFLDGEREGDTTKLAGEKLTGTIGAGAIKIADAQGNEKIKLQRTERKSPTLGEKAPAGAIVLFDGTNTEQWEKATMTEEKNLWCEATSKPLPDDQKIHLELRLSYMPEARGQGRSNSGVYVHQCYEIQVLDSFGLEGRSNECGGIYGAQDPIVNMCLPPLVWQTYDIDLTAPKYEGDKKVANARITILHNGVKIADNLELKGGTPGCKPEGPGPRGLYLQGHGNKVQYRNIWVEKK